MFATLLLAVGAVLTVIGVRLATGEERPADLYRGDETAGRPRRCTRRWRL